MTGGRETLSRPSTRHEKRRSPFTLGWRRPKTAPGQNTEPRKVSAQTVSKRPRRLPSLTAGLGGDTPPHEAAVLRPFLPCVSRLWTEGCVRTARFTVPATGLVTWNRGRCKATSTGSIAWRSQVFRKAQSHGCRRRMRGGKGSLPGSSWRALPRASSPISMIDRRAWLARTTAVTVVSARKPLSSELAALRAAKAPDAAIAADDQSATLRRLLEAVSHQKIERVTFHVLGRSDVRLQDIDQWSHER